MPLTETAMAEVAGGNGIGLFLLMILLGGRIAAFVTRYIP
jgi:hypothetical protein